MAKKKSLEDIYYPVPQNLSLSQCEKPPMKNEVIRHVIRGAIRGAFHLKTPYRYSSDTTKPIPVSTAEQANVVIHLIESLQPVDAIEAALASQFAITYIRGLQGSSGDGGLCASSVVELFEFGHQVLEALLKYRSKGAQQISVQYNVNQGQVVNIKNVKKEDPLITVEGAAV